MMKNAREMKQKTLKNCEIVKWIDANVPQMIEQAAEKGYAYIEIMTDNIDAPFGMSRGFIVDRVQEYVASFDYYVYSTANYKKITIDWNIVFDK